MNEKEKFLITAYQQQQTLNFSLIFGISAAIGLIVQITNFDTKIIYMVIFVTLILLLVVVLFASARLQIKINQLFKQIES